MALSLVEGATLALLEHRRSHGFELAKNFAPDAQFGLILPTKAAVVYRAIKSLHQDELLTIDGEEPSERGPVRTVWKPTAQGSAALNQWLDELAYDLRDFRVGFVLRLQLRILLDLDRLSYIESQLAVFEPDQPDPHSPSPENLVESEWVRQIWRRFHLVAAREFLLTLRERYQGTDAVN